MISAIKHMTVEDVQERIEHWKAWEEAYTRATEDGVMWGKFITWEEREIARDYAEDAAYNVRRWQRVLREMERTA